MSQRDRDMILSPERWPRWPYLPLVRFDSRGPLPSEGLLVAARPGRRLTVYHVNLWELPQTARGFRDLAASQYDSVDDLLADGWVVD